MRTHHLRRAVVVTTVALFTSTFAAADLALVGPFVGSATDTFNQHDTNMAVQSLPVFGGLGEFRNLTSGGAIKVEFSSSFGGDLVTPISDMMCGQLGVGQWTFTTPVSRFGGWWENNSGADDATVEFFDIHDAPIGVMTADTDAAAQQWTWNGWESTVPISRIVVTGNGVLNGFLWYENMQINVVPAPGAAALFPLIALLGTRRRCRRREDSGQV